MRASSTTFPFSAIVGQDRMKRALLVNAINPRIGGVLIMGQRGSAKSTAARALAHLFPSISVRVGCPIGCDPHTPESLCPTCVDQGTDFAVQEQIVPFVSLPLGATEDRVTGTLDLEGAITQGKKRWDPGLLAKAHRGILYIDEVNLLPDHLMDLLLDVAASGINMVEREGISLSHPSRFLLVGTMNPDEGDLRPQLLDRFGLCVEVETIHDPDLRTDVVSRTLAFESDPETMVAEWKSAQEELQHQLRNAREGLRNIQFMDGLPRRISELCCQAGVEGLRADIVVQKTAMALAALDGVGTVRECDVEEAAEMALAHRRKTRPDPPSPQKSPSRKQSSSSKSDSGNGSHAEEKSESKTGSSPQGSGEDDQQDVPQGQESPPLIYPQVKFLKDKMPSKMGRHREDRRMPVLHGPVIGASMPKEFPLRALAVAATIRAAALRPVQPVAAGSSALAIHVTPEDFRVPIYQGQSEWLYLFVLDVSGSMAARRRMEQTKELMFGLLETAYRKRDRVGLVTFSGAGVHLALSPTRSVRRAQRYVQDLPVGGRTPLADALVEARHIALRSRMRLKGLRQAIVVVSDGRNTVAPQGVDPLVPVTAAFSRLKDLGVPIILLDAEEGAVRLGLMSGWARQFGFVHVPFSELQQEHGALQLRLKATA